MHLSPWQQVTPASASAGESEMNQSVSAKSLQSVSQCTAANEVDQSFFLVCCFLLHSPAHATCDSFCFSGVLACWVDSSVSLFFHLASANETAVASLTSLYVRGGSFLFYLLHCYLCPDFESKSTRTGQTCSVTGFW